MRPLRLSFLCLLLVTATVVFAQDKPKTGVVLYRDRLAQQFDTVKVVKNIFKLNPLLFFRGEIPLYYERALTRRVRAELAVGFTARNYIGNSLIGHHVNFEAGSVCANHFNERNDKTIFVMHRGERINTGVTKFGALVGDHVKIGANAVLSPGTILEKNRIVGRLELINQTN